MASQKDLMYRKQSAKMVNHLRKRGITDEQVLTAMESTPRHKFVAAGMEFQAYEEKALPIGFGQTISHPYTVALMSQVLQVQKGQRIMEIGTGSGYQAAVLCRMGAQVFTIEKNTSLSRLAEKRLKSMNCHFVIRTGDGSLGWQSYAPFDAIIVTAGAPVVPRNLLQQVKEGGRLLIPVGTAASQELTLFVKDEQSSFRKIIIENLNFVPLKGVDGWSEEV
ncbi:MAG: protein-L-isoaspartate(D-aspartate) O-methyltransferase [Caldithrix sp.]|nr:protein-L-isoaspartate(D-aspartate) O-methyltransferase [Caldithrix sp.]